MERRNTTIESELNGESMHNDDEEEDEKSRASSSSSSIETKTTTRTTTSYSTSHLNSLFDDFSYQDSTVPRPVHHDGEACLCYENREDCTTCSTQCTEDSEIFLLTSSESVRSQAGSSSEDGPSLDDPLLGSTTSGFSLTLESLGSSEGFSEESCSEISNLQLDDYDQLIQSLHKKKQEFHEEFNKNSTIFGQLMALHGFQRAVLNDRLLDLDHKISSINTESEAPPTTTTTTETEEFDELDLCHLLLKQCQEEHVEVRRYYLERLMDEDLMKSNQVRIQEITEKLTTMTFPSPPPPPTTPSEEEYLDGILDDVSTCQSFCLDDL